MTCVCSLSSGASAMMTLKAIRWLQRYGWNSGDRRTHFQYDFFNYTSHTWPGMGEGQTRLEQSTTVACQPYGIPSLAVLGRPQLLHDSAGLRGQSLQDRKKLHGLLWPSLKNHLASLLMCSIGQSNHKPTHMKVEETWAPPPKGRSVPQIVAMLLNSPSYPPHKTPPSIEM